MNEFEKQSNLEQKGPTQEKLKNKLKVLQYLKRHIESVRGQESEKAADMTFLIGLGETLEDVGYHELAKK